MVEAAVPLRSLGLTGKPGETIRMGVARCDTPFDGRKACGEWGLDLGKSAVTGVIQLSDD